MSDGYADALVRWRKRAFRAYDLVVATLLVVLTTATVIATIALAVKMAIKVMG